MSDSFNCGSNKFFFEFFAVKVDDMTHLSVDFAHTSSDKVRTDNFYGYYDQRFAGNRC